MKQMDEAAVEKAKKAFSARKYEDVAVELAAVEAAAKAYLEFARGSEQAAGGVVEAANSMDPVTAAIFKAMHSSDHLVDGRLAANPYNALFLAKAALSTLAPTKPIDGFPEGWGPVTSKLDRAGKPISEERAVRVMTEAIYNRSEHTHPHNGDTFHALDRSQAYYYALAAFRALAQYATISEKGEG